MWGFFFWKIIKYHPINCTILLLQNVGVSVLYNTLVREVIYERMGKGREGGGKKTKEKALSLLPLQVLSRRRGEGGVRTAVPKMEVLVIARYASSCSGLVRSGQG